MKARRTIALIVILLGTIFLLNNLFDLDLSIIKLLLAIGFVALGILLLSGRRVSGFADGTLDDKELVIFGSAYTYPRSGPKPENYTTIFGERTLKFDRVDTAEKLVTVSAYFAENTLLIPKDMPVTIRAHAVFGEVRLPDGKEVNFGDRSFAHKTDEKGSSVVLQVTAVFGEVKCIWV